MCFFFPFQAHISPVRPVRGGGFSGDDHKIVYQNHKNQINLNTLSRHTVPAPCFGCLSTFLFSNSPSVAVLAKLLCCPIKTLQRKVHATKAAYFRALWNPSHPSLKELVSVVIEKRPMLLGSRAQRRIDTTQYYPETDAMVWYKSHYGEKQGQDLFPRAIFTCNMSGYCPGIGHVAHFFTVHPWKDIASSKIVCVCVVFRVTKA